LERNTETTRFREGKMNGVEKVIIVELLVVKPENSILFLNKNSSSAKAVKIWWARACHTASNTIVKIWS
jgi:hypothetical protein